LLPRKCSPLTPRGGSPSASVQKALLVSGSALSAPSRPTVVTAAIVRAAISSGALAQSAGPLKASYFGPMFRYERPQKGRHRQFYQCGVELLGDSSVAADADMIGMAYRFLQRCQADRVPGSDLVLLLNTLGDRESRARYETELSAFLRLHRGSLSSDSQQRLDRGSVLRVLDSKAEEDQAVVAHAPRVVDWLTPASAARQAQLERLLGRMELPVQVDHRLVRGLDYYNHVVFEFVLRHPGAWTEAGVGHIGTVLAGGRYDGLVNALGGGGGCPVPSVGWAAGVDRIVALTQGQEEPERALVEVLPLSADDAAGVEEHSTMLAWDLRRALPADCAVVLHTTPRAAKKQIGAAAKRGAHCVLLVGPDEVARGTVNLRCMTSHQDWTLSRSALAGAAVQGSPVASAVVKALAGPATQ
jgi:histidyl-tRNA synthetase